MNIALILAGGTGSRMKMDMPKQYVKVKEKMIIEYCMDTIFKDENIDFVQIVIGNEWKGIVAEKIPVAMEYKFRGFSEPGANRQLSILNGLEDIRKYPEYSEEDRVLIHDAARPNVNHKLITDSFKMFDLYNIDGVLPVLTMKDTIYYSDDGKLISSLMDRQKLYAGQAPEIFRVGKYYEAVKKLLPDKILNINGSTEPALLSGMNIKMIDGDENNFKITTVEDLRRFEEMLEREE